MSRLVTDYLPLLAGAPNGVKKLRELILELAVRGKLVHQNEGEASAEYLLLAIDEKKKQILNEGRFKKINTLPFRPLKDAPFELPTGWEWVKFGTLGLIGSSSRVHQKDWQSSGIPFYRTREIVRLAKQGAADNELFISEELYESLTAGGMAPSQGDLMITGVGTIGIPYLVSHKDKFYFKDASVLIFKNLFDIYTGYIYKFLTSPFWIESIHAESMGTTVHTLTIGRATEALIPLPPIAEQHRIVAKVDELMALCDRLETRQSDAQAAHARLVDELLGSLLQARDAEDFAECWGRVKDNFDVLFTTEQSVDRLKQALVELAVMGKIVEQDPADEHADEFANRLIAVKSLATADARKQKELTAEILPPFDAPNGWAWKKLDDLLQISGGVTLGRKFGDKALVSKPYLRVANVQRGHLDLNQVKEVDIPEDEIDRYVLRAGDLLVTEGGDWDKVGRTCIWNDELAECLHQNHIFRARSESDEFFVRWAEMYLNSAPARNYFAGSSKQTTNLASINMTQLRSCAFPLPPLAEQRRIVAKVDELMALCDRIKGKFKSIREFYEPLATALAT